MLCALEKAVYERGHRLAIFIHGSAAIITAVMGIYVTVELMRSVERTNSELKECFLPEKLYSRGLIGVFQIELAILMLDIKKIAARLRVESEAKEVWKMA